MLFSGNISLMEVILAKRNKKCLNRVLCKTWEMNCGRKMIFYNKMGKQTNFFFFSPHRGNKYTCCNNHTGNTKTSTSSTSSFALVGNHDITVGNGYPKAILNSLWLYRDCKKVIFNYKTY